MLFALLAAALGLPAQAVNQPPLQYAFTISSYNQASGSPQQLPGYTRVAGVGVNSTISGPLLNASLVALEFTEYVYTEPTNFSTSTANAQYMTDDGIVFPYYQIGSASNNANVATFTLDIGGDYAYLSQYVFVCYTPILSGSNFTSRSLERRNNDATAVKGVADCFVVGSVDS